ncbi:MAG: hypothetical protein NC393_13080 [Clostridium sp.]|nr:hypothetical protein [Clostridium sp.]MCM1173043.1 hypothetical protein [Clostridium sp.]MCM1209898.1 hypothetical protein [Ruminococcus sp.]
MATDIILDDWALPAPIDVLKKNQGNYNYNQKELDKNIQQNREIVKRIRGNKKYESILQKVL